ncbi:MAG: hypothetical protein ACTSV0_01310 [Candidatus Freyarchaeota archaeon]
MLVSEAMYAVLRILELHIKSERKAAGKIVIGTLEGDVQMETVKKSDPNSKKN